MIRVDGYAIDVARFEEHDYESDVTEEPVESGAAINDHVIPRNPRLSLDCVISNTPIGPVADERDQLAIIDGEQFALPADEGFARLLQIWRSRRPVPVETGLRRYDNMVLVRLGVPRSSKTGDTLEFRAEFVEINIRTNERSVVRVAVPRSSRKRNLGHKAAEQKGDPPPAYLLRENNAEEPPRFVGANANGRRLVRFGGSTEGGGEFIEAAE